MAKKKLNTAKTGPVDSARKVEITGIILIAIAVLLGLSILSYTSA